MLVAESVEVHPRHIEEVVAMAICRTRDPRVLFLFEYLSLKTKTQHRCFGKHRRQDLVRSSLCEVTRAPHPAMAVGEAHLTAIDQSHVTNSLGSTTVLGARANALRNCEASEGQP